MLKILAIGNSFLQDATTYLHDLAKRDGIDLKVVNLYIGGCSLETHWNNIVENKVDYEYQLNGKGTGRYVSILETLYDDEWDIITLQQCSHYSGMIETYQPYIRNISNYIKERVPKAKQYIHQTWSYELDSDHPGFAYYHNDQEEMFRALDHCYQTVATELSLGQIPCGKVIQKLRSMPAFDYPNRGISLCRDGFHLDYLYGRYAAAATWYAFLAEGNILDNQYIPPAVDGVEATEENLRIIKQCVHEIVNIPSKA